MANHAHAMEQFGHTCSNSLTTMAEAAFRKSLPHSLDGARMVRAGCARRLRISCATCARAASLGRLRRWEDRPRALRACLLTTQGWAGQRNRPLRSRPCPNARTRQRRSREVARRCGAGLCREFRGCPESDVSLLGSVIAARIFMRPWHALFLCGHYQPGHPPIQPSCEIVVVAMLVDVAQLAIALEHVEKY